jgi:hypothetical protein
VIGTGLSIKVSSIITGIGYLKMASAALITIEEIRRVMELKSEGTSHAEIYRIMNITPKRLENILTKVHDEGIRDLWHGWKHILHAPRFGAKSANALNQSTQTS